MDEKGLGVAAKATRIQTLGTLTREEHDDLVRAAITAYLARSAEPVAWIEPSDMAALSRIKAQRGGTRIAALKAFPCKGDVALYTHPKEAPDV